MNIFSKLKAKNEQAAKSAHERYLELLTTLDANAATDAQQDKLDGLVRELGFTMDRVAADHATVQTALEKHGIGSNFDKTRAAIEPAEQAYLKACADRQQAHRDQNEKVTKALIARDDAQGAHDETVAARDHLLLLEQSDPTLAASVATAFSASKKTKSK